MKLDIFSEQEPTLFKSAKLTLKAMKSMQEAQLDPKKKNKTKPNLNLKVTPTPAMPHHIRPDYNTIYTHISPTPS